MSTQTITITSFIPLPKKARPQWENKEAIVEVFDDMIIVKRITPPAWDEILPKLRRAGKQIPPKIIRDAVVWARRNP